MAGLGRWCRGSVGQHLQGFTEFPFLRSSQEIRSFHFCAPHSSHHEIPPPQHHCSSSSPRYYRGYRTQGHGVGIYPVDW